MATGDTLIIFHPYHNIPPATSYATIDIRNYHPVLDFALGETAVFNAIMPQHYNGGGVTVYWHYAMTSATSGTIRLDTSFERIGDQILDIDGDSFASAQVTSAITVPGTSGFVDIVTIAHTNGAQMDGVVKGEGFRLKIERTDSGIGEASGDLELLFAEIQET